MDIEHEGKKLTRGDSFVSLGGAVCGDGKTEREMYVEGYRPVRTRGERWGGGDGGPADLKKTKSKVMGTCVTPACLYGTETLARTEIQQQRLQVCETSEYEKQQE